MNSISLKYLKIVFFPLGVLSALLLTEVICRLFIPPPPSVNVLNTKESGFEQRNTEENKNKLVLGLKGGVGDGGILYYSTPTGKRMRANSHAIVENQDWTGRTIEINTNSLGYRNREIGEKVNTRVLFLGDSITVQDYLAENETFVRMIEGLSSKSKTPLETINSGITTLSLGDEFAILMETGLSTKPDVVVLNWFLNDAESSPGIQVTAMPDIVYASRLAWFLSTKLNLYKISKSDYGLINPHKLESWKREVASKFPPEQGDILKSKKAFNYKIQEAFSVWGNTWSDDVWDQMFPIFKELKRQSQLNGFKLLIVAFPVEEQIRVPYIYDYPQQKLRKIADDLDIPYLDLLPILRKANKNKTEPLYLDFAHPTIAGNYVISTKILEFIQKNI